MPLLRFLLLVLALNAAGHLSAQQVIERYTRRTDSLRIGAGPKDFLKGQEQGYTLLLPKDTVRGVLLSLEEDRFNLADTAMQVSGPAAAHGYAVLYVSTGVPVDFYFGNQSLRWVDSCVRSVFLQYRLPASVYLIGVGMGGHRALRYLRAYGRRHDEFLQGVRGVVLCESAIDWVRQWYEEKKAVRDNFFPSSVFSGKMVSYLLEKNLGGTPKNNLQAYLDFSGYSYFNEHHGGINPGWRELRVRAYTEPAPHYWMEARGKGTFDTNFPDMVGIINELKLWKAREAELVVFTQDQTNKDRRNPFYTWKLVNKEELLRWIDRQ